MEICGCFRRAPACPYTAAYAVAAQNLLLMMLTCYFGVKTQWCVLKNITYRRGLKEQVGELHLPGIFRRTGFHLNALPATHAVHNLSAALDATIGKPLLDRKVLDLCKWVNHGNSYVL